MSHHLRPVFLLFSQLPDLIETLDPQPLEELLPGEERAHLDPIGIRDGFSFLNSWSGGHLSAVFEDICVGHDVLATREPSCAEWDRRTQNLWLVPSQRG